MPATDEQVKCRCGLGMTVLSGGARFCQNCDTVQPQEAFGYSRRKTTQDVRFEMSWLRTISEEYVDNTQPEVGTTNPDDGADTPPESEGEDHAPE